MNKTEMVAELARRTEITQAKAAEVVDVIFSTVPGQGLMRRVSCRVGASLHRRLR